MLVLVVENNVVVVVESYAKEYSADDFNVSSVALIVASSGSIAE